MHSFYSPIGWHFGHVGRTEEFWVVGEALKRPLVDDHLSFLFADLADNPKDNRVNIPDRAGICEYLGQTRLRVLDALEASDLDGEDPYLADGYAWEFAIQHEFQHQETIAEMLQLIHLRLPFARMAPLSWRSNRTPRMVEIPDAAYCMGTDDRHAYDNEKEPHEVRVESFRIGETPVTAFEWSRFIEDGGYRRDELWSEIGRSWRDTEGAVAPEYWLREGEGWLYVGPRGVRPIHPDEAASSMSWFEAEAYARWAGKRLPTEEEWEYVATRGPSPSGEFVSEWTWQAPVVGSSGTNADGVTDLTGSVWQWTSSPFMPYPGFVAFPYDGYSKDHMRGAHRVCRGGSWATSPRISRPTFRNWYVPTYRQGILGLRLAE